jgi:FMN-dependent NADH-azoreductase
VPHLDWATFLAESVPVADRSPEQQALTKVNTELIDDLAAADIVLLGVPMYSVREPASSPVG